MGQPGVAEACSEDVAGRVSGLAGGAWEAALCLEEMLAKRAELERARRSPSNLCGCGDKKFASRTLIKAETGNVSPPAARPFAVEAGRRGQPFPSLSRSS